MRAFRHLPIILLTVMIVASVAVYMAMPAEVPLHWNSEGKVDRYGSKVEGVFGLPSSALGLYVIMSSVLKFYRNVAPARFRGRIPQVTALLMSLEVTIFACIWVYQMSRTFALVGGV